MKQKVLVKNDHGYIGNRGKSVYWGVTTRKLNEKDRWMVSFRANDLNQTVSLSPVETWKRVAEADMARVAAYVYEQGQTFAGLGSALIESACGKYVMWINRVNRTIYRRPKKDWDSIYNYTNVEKTLDAYQEQEATPVAVVEQAAEQKKAPDGFTMLVSVIPRLSLTQEQCLALVEILKAKAKQ